MLIGNYSVLSKHPGRDFGGGAIGLGNNRNDFNKSSTNRNVFFSTTWQPKSGVPDGYRPGIAWIIPITPGALSARHNVLGISSTVSSIAGGKNAAAALAGIGDLTGTAQLIISMVSALTGSGTISNADALAFLALAANLAGAGNLNGAAAALAHAASVLSGAGQLTTTASALGELASSITVAGELLTLSTIGSAVWSIAIESGLTARQAMRLISAATAGEVSGAATNTVTFKNAVDDDTSRIIATTDTDGNRTAITYDLE